MVSNKPFLVNVNMKFNKETFYKNQYLNRHDNYKLRYFQCVSMFPQYTVHTTDPHHISLNNDMYCPFTYYIAIISIH